MEEIVEKLKEVILEENDKLREEVRTTINQENKKLREEFKETIQHENDKLREEVKQNMQDLSKEILDRQFVFESEYGTKIDAIYDYVQFHQNTNLKRFDWITDLEKRVDEIEVHNFNHEKRISTLERKKA